jgi:hypothetical protein
VKVIELIQLSFRALMLFALIRFRRLRWEFVER